MDCSWSEHKGDAGGHPSIDTAEVGKLAMHIERFATASIAVSPASWPFADANRDAIASHWVAERKRRPGLFNGPVHLLRGHTLSDGHFAAEALATDFASFLYWRDHGYPDRDVLGTGVAAVLRARDGELLLGEAAEGTANGGRIYLFSGVLDGHDRHADGTLDLVGLAIRELAEEAGLAAAELNCEPGVAVIFDGIWVTFAFEFRSPLVAGALAARIGTHIAATGGTEIAGVHVVRGIEDIDEARMFGHTKAIIRDIFGD